MCILCPSYDLASFGGEVVGTAFIMDANMAFSSTLLKRSQQRTLKSCTTLFPIKTMCSHHLENYPLKMVRHKSS